MMSKRRLPPADAGFDALRIRTPADHPRSSTLKWAPLCNKWMASEVVESVRTS